MSIGIRKFVNYTKEAFFWPFHLIGLGILTLVTTAAMIVLPKIFGADPTGLIFVFGGLEMIFLSMITRSKRFRRAINMKYHNELQAYAYVKKLTEYYNILSAKAQRRFEDFRLKLIEAKKTYSSLNERFPDLIGQYERKIDALQLNYLRLLASHDRFPELMRLDNPTTLRAQIEEIRAGMGDDSPKLREVKEKRIKLLQERMRNYDQLVENAKVIDQQLKTIEEMVKYFQEQPLADRSADGVDMIDNLLTETNDLHSTLNEVEDIMRTDLTIPSSSGESYSDMNGNLRIE